MPWYFSYIKVIDSSPQNTFNRLVLINMNADLKWKLPTQLVQSQTIYLHCQKPDSMIQMHVL